MRRFLIALLLGAAASAQAAGVAVDQAWARASVPGQSVGGVFMQVHAEAVVRLLGVSCECAAKAEFHVTTQEKGVARMREQKELFIPAGKTLGFAPGGLHVMLLGLKAPLRAGEVHRLRLTLAVGSKQTEIEVPFTVRPLGEAPAADAAAHHHHH